MSGMAPARRTLVAGAVLTVLLGACHRRGEAGPVRLGLLVHEAGGSWMAMFREELSTNLKPHGWIEGANLEIVPRASDRLDRVPSLVDELAQLDARAIVVNYLALAVARRVTRRPPLVCFEIYDAQAEGLSGSLARPDDRVTGVSWRTVETASKRVGLAMELVPGLARIVHVYDALDPGSVLESEGIRRAAARGGLTVLGIALPDSGEALMAAEQRIAAHRAGAMLVSSTARTLEQLAWILSTARAARLPTISEVPVFADKGVLLTYGPVPSEMDRLGAASVDRLLRGVAIEDVPIVQPTQFECVLNRRTARDLGLVLPDTVLLQATRVIG